MFAGGLPLEEGDHELDNGDEVIVVAPTKYLSEKVELCKPCELAEGDISQDEEPLSNEEVIRVFENLDDATKADINILTDIGFDLETAFYSYCMCSGNKEAAVELMLNGLVNVNLKRITEFLCRRFPNAVRAVRPTLLTRRRNFGSSGQSANLDEILFRALMSGARLGDIVNV